MKLTKPFFITSLILATSAVAQNYFPPEKLVEMSIERYNEDPDKSCDYLGIKNDFTNCIKIYSHTPRAGYPSIAKPELALPASLSQLKDLRAINFPLSIFGDISVLSNLTKIEYIEFGVFSGVPDLKPLAGLPALHTLAIERHELSNQQIEDIANLPALKKVFLKASEETRKALRERLSDDVSIEPLIESQRNIYADNCRILRDEDPNFDPTHYLYCQ